jgi:hypothetical protein
MVGELIKTILLCIKIKNREVTKASFGFIKVAIVCLKVDLLQNFLEPIVIIV